jgi:hypothetical protein
MNAHVIAAICPEDHLGKAISPVVDIEVICAEIEKKFPFTANDLLD